MSDPINSSLNALIMLITESGTGLFGELWPIVWTLCKIALIVAPMLLSVAYLTWAERKIIGYMQVRIGPNRVGPWGLLQPIADGVKAVFKEIVLPAQANKAIFLAAPMFGFVIALITWAVMPFTDTLVLANINASLLYVMAIGSMGVYAIILSGWASNSKYALLGGMRSAAQMISYEIAMGFALICVLMVSNSLNLIDIVNSQKQGWFAEQGVGIFSWNWIPLWPMFLVYLISGVVETNRAPFDMAEGESEIVGFHCEYSGISFALFFLAEYTNMILMAALTSLLFLGGWLSPISILPDGIFWLFAKMFCVLFFYLWIRATFPRYRYDQIMRLGWKVFIPISIFWLLIIGLWMMSPLNIWA